MVVGEEDWIGKINIMVVVEKDWMMVDEEDWMVVIRY
jgi:hypothetical protein